MTLKITPEHLQRLREAIAPFDTAKRRARYIKGQFPRAESCTNVDTRYCWDLLSASGLRLGDGVGIKGDLDLYAYLQDEHIHSALRAIVEPLEGGSPGGSRLLWNAEKPGTVLVALESVLQGGTKAELAALTQDLSAELRLGYAQLPQDTRKTLSSGEPSSVGTAYMLGQLAFAQMLAAEVLAHRADDNLEQVVNDEAHGPIVQELLGLEQTVNALAEKLGLSREVVTDRVQHLLGMGVVDFRLVENSPQYFLTPIVRAVVLRKA